MLHPCQPLNSESLPAAPDREGVEPASTRATTRPPSPRRNAMPQTALTDQTVVGVTNAGAQFAPAVAALPGSAYVIVWLDSTTGRHLRPALRFRRPAGRGRVPGQQRRGSAPLFASVGALDGGGFVVAWQYGSFSSADIHARRFDAAGTAVGAEFTVNSSLAQRAARRPRRPGSTAAAFLVTWDNIVARSVPGRQRPNLQCGRRTRSAPTSRSTPPRPIPRASISVAPLAGGGFVATWQSVDAGGQRPCPADRPAVRGRRQQDRRRVPGQHRHGEQPGRQRRRPAERRRLRRQLGRSGAQQWRRPRRRPPLRFERQRDRRRDRDRQQGERRVRQHGR